MSVNIKPYGLIVLLWLCVPALARDVGGFNTWLPAGTLCRVPIEEVHPTQFAVGYWEVNHRTAAIARQSRTNLDNHRGRGPQDAEQLLQKVTGLTSSPSLSVTAPSSSTISRVGSRTCFRPSIPLLRTGTARTTVRGVLIRASPRQLGHQCRHAANGEPEWTTLTSGRKCRILRDVGWP